MVPGKVDSISRTPGQEFAVLKSLEQGDLTSAPEEEDSVGGGEAWRQEPSAKDPGRDQDDFHLTLH